MATAIARLPGDSSAASIHPASVMSARFRLTVERSSAISSARAVGRTGAPWRMSDASTSICGSVSPCFRSASA
jgi:hypothetical protein